MPPAHADNVLLRDAYPAAPGVLGDDQCAVGLGLNDTVSRFFQLFTTPCTEWAALWSPSGQFSHPKFPKGIVGRQALTAFCESNQKSNDPVIFRQDGDMIVTSAPGACHILVPYVYGTAPTSEPLFINSGFESMIVSSHPFVIQTVTEFFNRLRRPFSQY
jgi:hypothetical protein